MSDPTLYDEINQLIGVRDSDLERIERTLTDGYAHALSLEGERRRLEKRVTEIAQGLERGDTVEKARELSSLVQRLDGNAGDLSRLRARLADLRRHANAVRVLSAQTT